MLLLCYFSHSSPDEIIDFFPSLQLKSITRVVCPDEDTLLPSVKAVVLNTLKPQNSSTSNDVRTNLWK